MAARAGGDEFVLFLPEATPEVAETVAQRIRNHVYRSLFPVGERLQRMTVSVGTATWPRDGSEPDDVVAAAQQRSSPDRELRQGGPDPPRNEKADARLHAGIRDGRERRDAVARADRSRDAPRLARDRGRRRAAGGRAPR